MRAKLITFLATFLIVFGVYFATSAPDIGLVDAGELTTVAATLSIAHPTGYPLYTNLGRVWLMFSPFMPARGMVVFSVLMGALGTAVLALTALRLLDKLQWIRPAVRIAMSVLLAVGAALSSTVWSSVSFTEVYPLTWLIASIILYVALISASEEGRSNPHFPLLVCYLWGLGFGNHFTILWFVPLILYIAIRFVRSSVNRLLSAAWCLALYLLGTSINLFLPIRSFRGPVLDWSAPHTLPGLLRHLTGWQYRVWMFEGNLSTAFRKLGTYIASVPSDFGWALTALAIIGLLVCLRRKQWLLLAIFACWLLGNIYNVNYDIPDISTYFLVFYAPLFIVATAGFVWLLEKLHTSKRNSQMANIAAIALAFAVPLVSLAGAGSSAIQSSNTFARDMAMEVLHTLPQNAFVIHGDWDIQSPYTYLSRVEHVRPDVVMLDLNLLQRPWYVRQEQRAHSEIFAGAQRQMDAFYHEVAPFESGKPFEGRRIETAFVGMVNTIIANQLEKRPVYIRDTYQTGHRDIAGKMKMTPGGYFLRVSDSTSVEPVLNADRLLAGLPEKDDRSTYLLHLAAYAASYQGDHAMQTGDTLTLTKTMDVCRKLGDDVPEIQKFLSTAEKFMQEKRDAR